MFGMYLWRVGRGCRDAIPREYTFTSSQAEATTAEAQPRHEISNDYVVSAPRHLHRQATYL